MVLLCLVMAWPLQQDPTSIPRSVHSCLDPTASYYRFALFHPPRRLPPPSPLPPQLLPPSSPSPHTLKAASTFSSVAAASDELREQRDT